jgi:hypothetical protein
MRTIKKATAYESYLQHEKFLDDQSDECPIEPARDMNYYLLVIFHADTDKRPCRPVVRLVHLPHAPQTNRNDTTANPRGVEMVNACQLCEMCSDRNNLVVDNLKIHSVKALAITDAEAGYMLNSVADINQQVSVRNFSLSHRSNLALIPRILHGAFPKGVATVFQLRVASSATDVQLAILMLQDILNPGRSVSMKIHMLHPYLATPDNLHDALSLFTQPLDTFAFKSDSFKFAVF